MPHIPGLTLSTNALTTDASVSHEPSSILRLHDPCTSFTPVSATIRAAFPGVTPAPAITESLPSDNATRSLINGIPRSAVVSHPEVSRRTHPHCTICSSASKGAEQASKARWNVTDIGNAKSTISFVFSASTVPSGFRKPTTTAAAPKSRHILTCRLTRSKVSSS